MLHEHARLDDRRRGAGGRQRGDFSVVKNSRELGARPRPGPKKKPATVQRAPKRGDVEGHVARAAGGPGIARDVDHRHRRLGRDASAVASPQQI